MYQRAKGRRVRPAAIPSLHWAIPAGSREGQRGREPQALGQPLSVAAYVNSLVKPLVWQAPLPRLPLLPGLSSLKLLRMFLPSLGKALSCSARFAFLSLSGSTRTLGSLFLCPLSWKARWQPSLGCFASTLDACARFAVLFRVYCRSYYARCCLLGGRGFHSGLSVLPRVYN